ncbi:MAG: hypothetical protein Q9225_004969 [Loekoesia sp. 1 TL-2023]
MPPDESDRSNLLLYSSPRQQGGAVDQTTLAVYGLFLERTQLEFNEGEHSIWNQDDHLPSHACNDHERSVSPSHNVEERVLQEIRPNFMPTRTIKVGPVDGNQDPRLVYHREQEGRIAVEPWATLSHCWGGSSPLKTTLATESQWQRGIPLDMMPPTFRDAVTITRKLGIDHLWIDSLCIIQDSAEDWEYEALRMNNVYKYGLLNIAADTSRTCNDGIFSSRNGPTAVIKLPLISQKSNIRSFMFVRPRQWNNFRNDTMGSSSTLSSRAWALQESILSPRTLHYGKQQMVWECLSFTLTESSAIARLDNNRPLLPGFSWSYKTLLPPGIVQRPSSQTLVEKDHDRHVSLYNFWLQIIANYTKRKLTVPSDIFPALAGIASILQVHLGDRYLAGLFEGDLLRSLLWQIIDPSSSATTSACLAPSWSWASVLGAIEPGINVNSSTISPQIVGNHAAKILKAETYRADGRITPAEYFLNAPTGVLLIEAYLLQGKSLDELQYEGGDLDSIEGDSTCPNTIYGREISIHLDMNEDMGKQQAVAILHLGAWDWNFGLTRPHSRRVETTFAGLVLRQSADVAQGIYRRIGTAKMSIRIVQNSPSYRFLEDAENLIASKWSKKTVTIV